MRLELAKGADSQSFQNELAKTLQLASRVRRFFAPSADDWLVAQVRASPAPDCLAVVTADRAVAGRARHRGAQVVSPRAFLARCRG